MRFYRVTIQHCPRGAPDSGREHLWLETRWRWLAILVCNLLTWWARPTWAVPTITGRVYEVEV